MVIGAGVAGCVYAHQAAKKGLHTIMLCCGPLSDANSDLAQGGIVYEPNLVMQDLLEDVQMATAHLCNDEAVRTLSEAGCKAIKEIFLKEAPVNFDRDEKGNLRFTREGAHRKNRIIYSKDTTGHALLTAIQKAVTANPLITVKEYTSAIDLLTLSHSSTNILDRYHPLTVFGAYVLDNRTGEVYAIEAKKTILATGGVGQVYRHTTNSDHAYGHGVAMAYRVGARVMNMEFVQFHPTVFAKGKNFLISEALRGEGAILRNVNGEAFMPRYHELKDLAPRDIVARAIEEERLKTSHDCVYLDITHEPAEFTKNRFPAIYKKCLESGVDLTKDPIPVAQEMADLLRNEEHCDAVICLSHLGIRGIDPKAMSDEKLVVATSGIDAILGGHSHTFMETPAFYPNAEGRETPVFHTGKNGVYVGVWTLTLTKK